MTKHPYLKDILKTTAKVVLIAGATLVATPYVFGFATGLLNTMIAGYIAGYTTAGVGTYMAVKTTIKDVFTMRERVKKNQREEYIDEQLDKLGKETQKLHQKQPVLDKETAKIKNNNQAKEKKPPQKIIKWGKNMFLIRKKEKEYDRAA